MFTCKSPNSDPFFFDGDDLRGIAEEQTLQKGLALFKEHSVVEFDQEGDLLWGKVADEEWDWPVDVQFQLKADGCISPQCGCGNTVCAHQVAVLFAYGDGQNETDQRLTAADTAINDRQKRGRTEVQVESTSGEPWFGTWRAWSMGSSSPFNRQYRVTIRSLQQRANHCTCPDYNGNQLGTCKHIEAVLHRVRKHDDYEVFKDQPPPFSYVYLAWDVEDAPSIRLHRHPKRSAQLAGLLDDNFKADGTFTGRLPEGFFRFVELVEERGDLHLGEDVLGYARHMATTAGHALRAAEISRRITGGNGRLQGVKARLYPYQVEGAAFLAGTGRALLADDMGLGKTLQAVAAAMYLKQEEGVRRSLIICPASLKHQWAGEISRFTDEACQIIQGPVAERGVQYRRDCTFFIVNYELVLRDLSVISETLCPDLVILDEAQRIKNWRTKIASAVKLIPSRYAFVLTGTPLENRLEDLYSLMQMVDGKVLGPLWRYMVDYHLTDQRGKVLGYRNLSRLRTRLTPVMLRRDRRLVRDQLPDRIVKRLDVGMTEQQWELHDAGMSAAGSLATLAKKRPLTPVEQNRLIAALQQARMAATAAGLVDKETEGAPKIDELVEVIDEVCVQGGLKVVVFSQWELMTRMVERRLTAQGIGCVRLHGGVPTARRGELLERFREDDSVQVFISTDAGGVGLNLQSGAVLINLDVPWNPAVLEQRNGRIHRLGQTRKVQIVNMVSKGSYEEKVLALVGTKQLLFDNVISEDASEDVVGISKKLVDALVDDLAEAAPTPGVTEEPAPEEYPDAGAVTGESSEPGEEDREIEAAITWCVEELQKAFGERIDRILGSNGGLIAVLDRVDNDADQVAQRLSGTVPVALMDGITLQGLKRLGPASPLAEATTYVDATPGQGPSRLRLLADQKLEAAKLLLEQALPDSALDLLVAALLAEAADRAGLHNSLVQQEAGVWLYGQAISQGYLNEAEVNLIMRAMGLAQCSEVPLELLLPLADEVDRFVNGPGL